MVVFEAGRPKRSEYGRFRLKTVEGPNDFASHQEMLRRRFRRSDPKVNVVEAEAGTENGDKDLEGETEGQNGSLRHEWALPDLIIIDGGKGQLSAAMEVLQELHID